MGASAGRVLLIPKGDWNAEATYTGLDWVRHNGAAWVCKNTCTNVEPTEENSDNWQIIARDGQSGSVINLDATMSDTSENPVQNKVIKKYVDEHTILTYKTKAEYDAAVANDDIPDGATVIKAYDD